MNKYTIIPILLFLIFLSTPKVEAAIDENIKNSPILSDGSTADFDQTPTNNYYRIVLTEDSRVQFDLVETTSLVSYGYFLNDKGNSLGRITTTPNERQAEFQLKAGTYYLTFTDGVVKYSVHPLNSPYDIEPNNSYEQAQPLKFGDTIKTQGTLDFNDDYYVFTIEEPSQITIFSTRLNYENLSIFLEDSDRKKYLLTRPSRGVQSEAAEILLPGTYYIHVEKTLGYEFRVEQTILDRNNKYKNVLSKNTLLENERIHALLGSNDYYYFSLEEEKRIKIRFKTTSKYSDMDAILSKIGGQYPSQITGYYEQDLPGEYIIIAKLKQGNYELSARSRYASEIDEIINYTVVYAEITYPDIPKDYSSYKPIMYLSTNGIIQGYPDGTFKPKNPITRRQVFTMLSRDTNLKLKSIRNAKAFKDAPRMTDDYFFINTFYQAGIIDGNTDGTIGLENQLTRGQLAKILVNTYNLKKNGTPVSFKDVSKKHFAYTYIEILSSNGIALGYNNEYKPDAPVTREEFSLFLSRVLQAQK